MRGGRDTRVYCTDNFSHMSKVHCTCAHRKSEDQFHAVHMIALSRDHMARTSHHVVGTPEVGRRMTRPATVPRAHFARPPQERHLGRTRWKIRDHHDSPRIGFRFV
jgi:hypothetical protein